MNSELKHICRKSIEAMDKIQRVNLVNSLPGYKSLNLVGTTNGTGQTNLSIVSTVTHFGSAPPLLGYVSRPESVDRHTLSNILETGSYTFNQVGESFFKQAHQTSARYPREISEFEAVGLTPKWIEGIMAPFVAESSVTTHLKLIEKIDIKANGTVLVIGEVIDVYASENCLKPDGNIDLEATGTLAGSGLDQYSKPEKLARLSYAKPDQPLSEL